LASADFLQKFTFLPRIKRCRSFSKIKHQHFPTPEEEAIYVMRGGNDILCKIELSSECIILANSRMLLKRMQSRFMLLSKKYVVRKHNTWKQQ